MNVYDFASYPNQKRIKIKKRKMTEGSFCTINTYALMDASKTLTSGGFRLYVYLSVNADGFEFWLSRTHVCEMMGISQSTYLKAVKELINKRFLEKTIDTGQYIFNEYPIRE